MRSTKWIPIGLALGWALAGTGWAQSFGGPSFEGMSRRARFLEKFDADGDGQLSEEERATARAHRRARRGRRGQMAGYGPGVFGTGVFGGQRLPGEDALGPGAPVVNAAFQPGGSGSGVLITEGEPGPWGFAERRGRRGEGRRARILARFDADGDGQLSEEERAALQQFRQQRRARLLEHFDADGDGRLDEAERQTAREAGRQRRRERRQKQIRTS